MQMDNRLDKRDSLVQFTQKHDQAPLSEWTVRLTLCLAPLFAHLIAGVPQVVYLHNSMPKWHDSLTLYNPTSIIWRYFAITERRSSTSNHTPSELAAINVVYWTDKGWDNSERQIQQGQALCIRYPPKARNRVFSGEGLKTLIVTVQGLTAVGGLLPGNVLNLETDSASIAGVFLPLAVMGLVRLPAAYWLTNDYNIMNLFEKNLNTQEQTSSFHTLAPLLHSRLSSASIFSEIDQTDDISPHRYRPSTISTLVRLGYILFLLFILGIALYILAEDVLRGFPMSLTRIWMLCGYTLFLVGCLCIYIPHFIQKKAQPTCIPCSNTIWYKCYTGFLIFLALGCTIVAALETSKYPDGSYFTESFPAGRLECKWVSRWVNSSTTWCPVWSHGRWTGDLCES